MNVYLILHRFLRLKIAECYSHGARFSELNSPGYILQLYSPEYKNILIYLYMRKEGEYQGWEENAGKSLISGRFVAFCVYAVLSTISLDGGFDDENKWRSGVCVKSLSLVRLFATPWTVAYQGPPSMGFSRQECWSGLPFPSPGDLPNPGIEPRSPAFQADALTSEPPGEVVICPL